MERKDGSNRTLACHLKRKVTHAPRQQEATVTMCGYWVVATNDDGSDSWYTHTHTHEKTLLSILSQLRRCIICRCVSARPSCCCCCCWRVDRQRSHIRRIHTHTHTHTQTCTSLSSAACTGPLSVYTAVYTPFLVFLFHSFFFTFFSLYVIA